MLAIGNEELAKLPLAQKGDMIDCPHCPDKHPLECGTNSKTGKEDESLLFYRCKDKLYLAAIDGKLLPFTSGKEAN